MKTDNENQRKRVKINNDEFNSLVVSFGQVSFICLPSRPAKTLLAKHFHDQLVIHDLIEPCNSTINANPTTCT